MTAKSLNRPQGGNAVKAIAASFAGFALLAAAGAASAQSPQGVAVGGTAAQVCYLPPSFTFSNDTGNGTGQFSGNTWTIPSTSIANANGTAVAGEELAIRITGAGFCNTAHRIGVSVTNGGLRRNGQEAPPAGFANSRPVKIDAHWANPNASSYARRFGPGIWDFVPNQPFAGATQDWVATPANGVPGARPFDVRLAVLRPAASMPLVAGDYSELVTVTLTPRS